MKRMPGCVKNLFLLGLCACLCLCLCAAAADTGVETDEDGGIWDYDQGIYTDPQGGVHEITPGGVSEDESGSGSGSEGGGPSTTHNPDGSITVITADEDPTAGALDLPPDDGPTRAPLEGDEWQAVLDSMAARNGAETPTVWTDPATGNTVPVSVVYMGVGRSMVAVNGSQLLVNTVDLKWTTEAPEDKVLARVDAPKNGYCWLRRQPSSDITNPKVAQIRTDTVMRVIGTGPSWTFVDYDGMRGYVQTSSLEFYANDHTEFEAGYLSLKGKIKGSDTVWLRSSDKGERMLKECVLGTPVTIFDIVDEWAEIDSCGFHCRIRSDRVTKAKDIPAAE